MIKDYVTRLIGNLPPSTTRVSLDVVLDGGLFNGSYLVGALSFLKEMERTGRVKIARISGCSIGAIVALLYFGDALDMMPSLYEMVYREFQTYHRLRSLLQLKTHLRSILTDALLANVQGRLFVTYYHVKQCRKRVKSVYSSMDELVDSVIRSCFVPYLIDGCPVYKGKYMDGVSPYIFTLSPRRRILYLDLFGLDKMTSLLNVKNEKTNFHRILAGLLEMHSFFIKESNTSMCSFVGDWTTIHRGWIGLKQWMEYCCAQCFFLVMRVPFPKEAAEALWCKLVCAIANEVFVILLETYCV